MVLRFIKTLNRFCDLAYSNLHLGMSQKHLSLVKPACKNSGCLQVFGGFLHNEDKHHRLVILFFIQQAVNLTPQILKLFICGLKDCVSDTDSFRIRRIGFFHFFIKSCQCVLSPESSKPVIFRQHRSG